MYPSVLENMCEDYFVLGAKYDSLITHNIETGQQDFSSFSSSLNLENVGSFDVDRDEGLLFFADADLVTIYKKNYNHLEDIELVKTLLSSKFKFTERT